MEKLWLGQSRLLFESLPPKALDDYAHLAPVVEQEADFLEREARAVCIRAVLQLADRPEDLLEGLAHSASPDRVEEARQDLVGVEDVLRDRPRRAAVSLVVPAELLHPAQHVVDGLERH